MHWVNIKVIYKIKINQNLILEFLGSIARLKAHFLKQLKNL